MLRSLYTATTGMLVQRNKMDTITNNLTNVDTIGYKKDYMLTRSFEDMLLSRINDPNVVSSRYGNVTQIGDHNFGLHIDEVNTNFKQGILEETGQINELAIDGEGFFVVNTPEGARYTRSGNFKVDAQGFLVDANGYYVQSNAGNAIFVGGDDFAVNAVGDVVVNGEVTATVAVVTFNDLQGLRKAGNNLYYHYQDQAPIVSANYAVKQGFIEGSNVDTASEMVDMISTSRAYESCYKITQMIDQSLSKTVNEIAKF